MCSLSAAIKFTMENASFSGRDLAIIIDDRKVVNIIAVSNLSKDIAIHNYGRVTLLPGLVDAHVHLVFPRLRRPNLRPDR